MECNAPNFGRVTTARPSYPDYGTGNCPFNSSNHGNRPAQAGVGGSIHFTPATGVKLAGEFRGGNDSNSIST